MDDKVSETIEKSKIKLSQVVSEIGRVKSRLRLLLSLRDEVQEQIGKTVRIVNRIVYWGAADLFDIREEKVIEKNGNKLQLKIRVTHASEPNEYEYGSVILRVEIDDGITEPRISRYQLHTNHVATKELDEEGIRRLSELVVSNIIEVVKLDLKDLVSKRQSYKRKIELAEQVAEKA